MYIKIHNTNIIIYPSIIIIVVASIHTEIISIYFIPCADVTSLIFDDENNVNLIGGMSRDVARLFKRNRPSATFRVNFLHNQYT